MTDELVLALAALGDISPNKVRLIIDAYEKARPPVPEGFTVFEYKGRHYAYKSLGDGSWTPKCAGLDLMIVLKKYFINSGKMEKGGDWPDSSISYAWTSDVDSDGNSVALNSDGNTYNLYYRHLYARFAVLSLDSERKNFIKESSHENEDYTIFEYKGRHYAYKSLGDGSWTPECAALDLMIVLKNYFINSGKMEKGGQWPGSSFYIAWTSDVNSSGNHVELVSDGGTYSNYGGDYYARFAVLPLDSERKNF